MSRSPHRFFLSLGGQLRRAVMVVAIMSALFVPAERAHALTSVNIIADSSTTAITNTLKNTLTELSTAAMTMIQKALQIKELQLDGLAWEITQQALNQLTADIISWVNGGLDGSGEPAFVTDLDSHLRDVRQREAQRFIYGDHFSELPEDTQFYLRGVLADTYTREQEYRPNQRALEAASDNPERFVQGDFQSGGWAAWYALTVRGEDKIQMAERAKTEMRERVATAEEYEREELGWGDGFKAEKECERVWTERTDTHSGFFYEDCETITPGRLISDAVSFYVGELPALKLVEADEINEVLSSLFQSLTEQVLRGDGGLLGLGGNDAYTVNSFGETGDQSYLEAMQAEQINTETASSTLRNVAESRNHTERYIEIQEEVIDEVDQLRDEIDANEARFPTCFAVSLPSALENDYANAEENLATAETLLEILTNIATVLESNPSPNDRREATQSYAELQAGGVLQSEVDIRRLEIEFLENDFTPRVQALESEIAAEVADCESS